MSGVDDEVLIGKARSGDRAAFNTLVAKHQERAYRFAYRLTRDADDASDVVAEGFVRVFNALSNFRSQSTFTTWLYRILTNCFLDMKKRDRHRSNLSLDAALQTEESEVHRQLEDPDGTPQDTAERTEREARFEAAIMHLSEYQRAMIVMYHAEQMSYEEIAAALDLPVGTVKSRLNRARLSLREILKKDEELFRI